MSSIKSILKNPYITLEWDEGETIRIPATSSDVTRIREGYADFKGELEEISTSQSSSLVHAIKKGLIFLCGETIGKELYEKAYLYISDNGSYPEEECVLQLSSVLVMVSSAWEEHLAVNDAILAEKLKKYVIRTDSEDVL